MSDSSQYQEDPSQEGNVEPEGSTDPVEPQPGLQQGDGQDPPPGYPEAEGTVTDEDAADIAARKRAEDPDYRPEEDPETADQMPSSGVWASTQAVPRENEEALPQGASEAPRQTGDES